MGKKTDLTGKEFGRWKVLYRSEERAKDNRKKYICECSCGTVKEVDGRNLSNGTSISCGCYSIEKVVERFTTHGLTGTTTYRTWAIMKDRCTNPKSGEYENYGARGIGYDPKWELFEGFLEDMGERPDGLSLDRIDVNGNYCKENCRWADQGVQSHGRRKLIYKNSKVVSRFIGVTWKADTARWRAKLVYKGKVIMDRTFISDVEAAKAYDKASEEYYADQPNKQSLLDLGEYE